MQERDAAASPEGRPVEEEGASGGREYASLNYLSVSLLDPLTRSFIERWVMLTGTLGIAAVGIDKFVAVME